MHTDTLKAFISEPRTATDTDYKHANRMATAFDGNIGGSWITNKDTAKDVDVFFSWSQFRDMLHRLGYGAWHNKYDPTYDFEFDGVTYDKKQWEYCDQYQESNRDTALICTYRAQGDVLVNVIVVDDCFYPAFVAAKNEMTRRPGLYTDRDARIKLHHDFRRQIWDMLGPMQDANDNLPF